MRSQDENNKNAEAHAQRLAAQLRANLARRKAQARSRRAGDADERAEGLPANKKSLPDDTGEH